MLERSSIRNQIATIPQAEINLLKIVDFIPTEPNLSMAKQPLLSLGMMDRVQRFQKLDSQHYSKSHSGNLQASQKHKKWAHSTEHNTGKNTSIKITAEPRCRM